MDYKLLSELLFPHVTMTPEEAEALYPQRNLPEGAKVTRFAPSPTGFVHFGGLFPVTVCERLAHQSGGVFFLRIEDTDAKREIEGARDGLIKTLSRYGISFDEGPTDHGDVGAYGPYTQSKRVSLYHVFAKKLVAEGHAYPVFTTEEELAALHAADKKAEVKAKDWHEDGGAQKEEMLKQRIFTIDEVKAHLAAGHPFVLRMLADGDPEKKLKVTDLVKGTLELPENDRDEVLLKSDGVPSYHFAHAVDDHLMGTTHVIRGEEWLPSLPRHLMLFRFLGFKAPKYMHIAQLMRLDEDGNKKKLSKRDLGANLDDYAALGYCPEAVNEYVMTLLNSNYEEWHTANPTLPYTDFPFSIKKMSASGCLFDISKLNDVSKTVLSRMDADTILEKATAWAKEFDPALYDLLSADPAYAKAIFAIGRGSSKPRKDLTTWLDVKPYIAFFYPTLFTRTDPIPEKFDRETVKKVLRDYLALPDAPDSSVWFDQVKSICEPNGFCPDMKAYKKAPDAFKGSVADVSMFLRIAITGRTNSPDLFTCMTILGRTETRTRIEAMIDSL